MPSIRELGHDPSRGMYVDYDYVSQFQATATGQYGPHANAEEMIQAHRSARDPALARTQLAAPDEEATAEVKEDMQSAESSFDLGEGEKLLDVSVRGNAMIGVISDAQGNWTKRVAPANDRYEAPPEAADAKALREAEAARSETAAKAAALREEAAKKLAEAREQIQTELGEKMASLQEEAAQEQAAAAEAQTKASEEGDTPKATPAAAPRTAQQQPRRS